MNGAHAGGFTLMEVLVAMALSAVVVLAIGQVDVSRVRLSGEVRRQAQSEAVLALSHIAQRLRPADRVNLISPSSIQIRQFIGDPTVGGAMDNPANYRWDQYTLVGGEILLYEDTVNGCGIDERFIATSLAVQFIDQAQAPPGGELAPPDNNLLVVTVDGRFTSQVTIRASAYSNVPNGSALPGVSNPPAAC